MDDSIFDAPRTGNQNPSAPKRYKTLEDLMLALKLYTENKITTAYVQMQLEKVARTTLKLKNEKDEDDVYTALGEKHVPDTFMRVVKHIVENVDAGATDFDLDSAVLMRMFDLMMTWVSYQHKEKGDKKKKTLIVTRTNVTQFSVDVLKAISPIDGCDLGGVYEAFYQATTDADRIANRKCKIAYYQEKLDNPDTYKSIASDSVKTGRNWVVLDRAVGLMSVVALSAMLNLDLTDTDHKKLFHTGADFVLVCLPMFDFHFSQAFFAQPEEKNSHHYSGDLLPDLLKKLSEENMNSGVMHNQYDAEVKKVMDMFVLLCTYNK